MRSSGYDPYSYIRQMEHNGYEWEQKRPVCDMCGDRIYKDKLYKIGPYSVCDNCIESAWDALRKEMPGVVRDKLGAYSDWIIMDHIIERMLEAYEISDFKNEYEERIDEH